MANDLLIKINADAKNAQKAFDDVRAQTEDLEETLSKVATVSAVAFAAFTAEIYFSVKAFEEARANSVQLSNALQNQGIYTDDLKNKYLGFADAVQAKTGIDNDAIIKAQAVAQTFLGQREVTEELSFAIADLGASMGGDLNGAAEKIARTIGTGTNAFARQGLVISEAATESERYAKVLEFVSLKAGGLAEEFNKADGYAKALETSFGNFQETIGSKFAPIVEAARKIAIGFFDLFTNNPVLADFAVAAIAAGTAVSGTVALVAAGIPAFLALKAAILAAGVSFNVAFVGIPLLIGAVVAAITLLVLNWDQAMAALVSAGKATVTLLSELFSGLGKILSGVFTLDATKLNEGFEQMKASFGKAKDEAVSTYTEIRESQNAEGEKQNAEKKALADKEAALEREHQANLRAIRAAEIELMRMQNEDASAVAIDLKSKEIAALKALDAETDEEKKALLLQRRSEILALQDEQQAEDLERSIAFAEIQAATKAELAAKGIEVEAQMRTDRLAQIQATAQTEADIDRKLQEDLLARKIQARNQELLDRKKYGVAAATMNKFLASEEVQGAKSATSELVQLQQSKNATLKAIGKAAAIADITVKTAQSAMNIYNGFSTIPIVGPALGVAGAAAAIAFGAEKIGQVQAAADGGLMEGGIPNRDSIPTFTMPGELVVPKRNFNEVVGAVKNQREGGDGEMLQLLRSIDEKFSVPSQTIIQGDVTADDSYVDALVRKISDAIEFRNAKIVGVNA